MGDDEITKTALGTAGGILGVAGGVTIGVMIAIFVSVAVLCGIPMLLCYLGSVGQP